MSVSVIRLEGPIERHICHLHLAAAVCRHIDEDEERELFDPVAKLFRDVYGIRVKVHNALALCQVQPAHFAACFMLSGLEKVLHAVTLSRRSGNSFVHKQCRLAGARRLGKRLDNFDSRHHLDDRSKKQPKRW